MTSNNSDEFMTQAELGAFAEKVEGFGRGLTEKEQAFLVAVIRRAAGAEEGDVQGFSINYNSSKSNTGNFTVQPLAAVSLIPQFDVLNSVVHGEFDPQKHG